MKKRILSALLAVCMLCCAAVSASAETLYATMYGLFTSESTENLYLGTPQVSTYDEENSYFMLYYDTDDQTITIAGKNTNGENEISWWSDIDVTKGLYLVYAMCGIWSTLEENVDEGCSIALGYTSGSNSDNNIWITSAAEAESFTSTVETLLGGEDDAEATVEPAAATENGN